MQEGGVMANNLLLTQALHTAEFTRSSLQDAARSADAVSGLLIMQMIRQAAELGNSIRALIDAQSEGHASLAASCIITR
jgi:hypothetical protein